MTALYWVFDGYVNSCGYQQTFRRNVDYIFYAEYEDSWVMLVSTYRTALCRNQENRDTSVYSYGNLKTYIH
jgi:hypothetical protein